MFSVSVQQNIFWDFRVRTRVKTIGESIVTFILSYQQKNELIKPVMNIPPQYNVQKLISFYRKAMMFVIKWVLKLQIIQEMENSVVIKMLFCFVLFKLILRYTSWRRMMQIFVDGESSSSSPNNYFHLTANALWMGCIRSDG